MSVTVSVHETVFPENLRRELLQGLRARAIAPKLHYQTYQQARRWQAVHEAHSPAKLDPDCARIYDDAFRAAAASVVGVPVHLIGLGCGGGQKEARLLRLLNADKTQVVYSPCDVSLALVLESRRVALEGLPEVICQPLLCDLAEAEDLPHVLDDWGFARLVTFFGVIPNVEPDIVLPKVAALIRPGDSLLISANLAPGADYAEGVRAVLPGYDNSETRWWLSALLEDLGMEQDDGGITFSIEETSAGLRRIVADYKFARDRTVAVEGEQFKFCAGESLRLFYSYRYTPQRIARLLADHRLQIAGQWVTKSGEEGVFQCQRCS